MCWETVAYVGTTALSSYQSSKSKKKGGKKAGKIAAETADKQIGFAREGRDIALMMSQPQREAGTAATAAMMDMVGLPRGYTATATGATGAPLDPALYPQMQYRNSGGGDKTKQLPMSFGLTPTHKDFLNSVMGGGDKPKKRWRRYAEDLEGYLGDNLPAGLDRPTGNKRNQWKRYAQGLDQYAQSRMGTDLPPGVTAPDLSSYDQYEWQTDPGYEFRLSEGLRATEAMSGARGNRLSGGTLKDAMTYGQRMGSQEYMNIYNRLATLAGYGQVGVQAGTQAGALYGTMGANIYGDLGYNRASAYTGGVNAESGFYGDLAGLAGSIPYGEIRDWWGARSKKTGGGFTPPSGYGGVGT